MSDLTQELEKMERKSKRQSRLFGKLFLVLAVVLFALEMFLLGYNLAKDNTQFAVSNGILAVFWLLAIWIQWRSALTSMELDYMDRDLKQMMKLADFAKELAEEAENAIGNKSHKDELTELLMSIIDEVTGGGRPPKGDEIAKIETEFHKRTGDHYLKLTVVQGGMQVEIKDKPFSTKSKSQQRREAVMKSAKKKGGTTTTTTTQPGQTTLV